MTERQQQLLKDASALADWLWAQLPDTTPENTAAVAPFDGNAMLAAAVAIVLHCDTPDKPVSNERPLDLKSIVGPTCRDRSIVNEKMLECGLPQGHNGIHRGWVGDWIFSWTSDESEPQQ